MTDYEQIVAEQKRRHAHNTTQERCTHCGSFVNTGQPENGQLRYHCKSCGRWQLEYVKPSKKAAANTD